MNQRSIKTHAIMMAAGIKKDGPGGVHQFAAHGDIRSKDFSGAGRETSRHWSWPW